MALVLWGMGFLFLKYNFTLQDMSLFYLMTNLFGLLILKLGLDEIESTAVQKINDQLWFYGVMNVLILACRLFDVHVYEIGLDYFESYILAVTLLFAHFYVFFFPLYIFSTLVKLDTHLLQKPFSYSVTYMVPIAVTLALVSFLTVTTDLVRVLLWVTIIVLELHASLRLIIINKKTDKLDLKLRERVRNLFKRAV
ncbi:MAG: hypothetical protein JJU16_08135 [Alkalibacterium sp.]|nr:hypothetical protein [Alkalibacterium sp.]